jgi:hypothetical protein
LLRQLLHLLVKLFDRTTFFLVKGSTNLHQLGRVRDWKTYAMSTATDMGQFKIIKILPS